MSGKKSLQEFFGSSPSPPKAQVSFVDASEHRASISVPFWQREMSADGRLTDPQKSAKDRSTIDLTLSDDEDGEQPTSKPSVAAQKVCLSLSIVQPTEVFTFNVLRSQHLAKPESERFRPTMSRRPAKRQPRNTALPGLTTIFQGSHSIRQRKSPLRQNQQKAPNVQGKKAETREILRLQSRMQRRSRLRREGKATPRNPSQSQNGSLENARDHAHLVIILSHTFPAPCLVC
jgi:hypothetical protein